MLGELAVENRVVGRAAQARSQNVLQVPDFTQRCRPARQGRLKQLIEGFGTVPAGKHHRTS
jgi:hypothetical protein